jgi:hypothetical protein
MKIHTGLQYIIAPMDKMCMRRKVDMSLNINAEERTPQNNLSTSMPNYLRNEGE